MASTAFNAQDTKLSIVTRDKVDPTKITVTPIKNIKSFSGFDGAAAEIDVTNLDSTAKEFRIGLKDNGSFSFEIDRDFADPGQVALLAAQVSYAATDFVIYFKNAETWATYQGYVKKFAIQGGVDQVVKASVDIRISGAVAFSNTDPYKPTAVSSK